MMIRIFLIMVIFSIGMTTILIAQNDDPFENLYYINAEEFLEIVEDKESQFHLIYSYAYWCKPCRATSPIIFDLVKSNPEINFYPLLVEKHGSDYVLENLEAMKEKYGYSGNVFMADLAYGKRHMKRYHAFISELAPNHEEYGYGLILLFKGRTLLIATNYNMTGDEKIELLKEALTENTTPLSSD